jgi:hypothetical protein
MNGKQISLDRFNLEKVKLGTDGGVTAHWEQTTIEGALTYIDQENKTSTKEPHPDLVNKIEILKPFLAKMWGVNYPVVIAESKSFGGDPKHIDAMKKAYNEQLKDITVTGISIKGKKEKLAVVITGKRRMYKNIFQPMNSGRIQLNQKLYGFENDLEDLVPEIKKEVYEYLFEDKCLNPTLFGENEQKEVPKSTKKTEKRKAGEPQKQEETI